MNKIIGYITNFSPDQAKGFAFGHLDEKPVEVVLYINGQEVDRQLAATPNKLLEDKNLPHNHGFSFDLKSQGAFHFKDQLVIKCEGQELSFAPNLSLAFHQRGFFLPAQKDLFFFMHVPKTAGTSFRMMLNKIFDQDHIWPNRDDLSENNRRYPNVAALRNLDQERKDSASLMMGHYPLWVLRFMRQRPRVVTFLREPKDHILSLAKHKQARDKTCMELSLDEIIKDFIVDNPQCYYFMPAHIPTTAINDDRFEVILRNLNSCEGLGLQNRFEESIAHFEKRFNWDLGLRLSKNVGKEAEVSETTLELIESKTNWDQKLFAAATELFNERTKS